MSQTAFPLNNTKYFAQDVQLFHYGRTAGIFSIENGSLVVLKTVDSRTDVIVNSGYAFLHTGTSENGMAGGIVYRNTEPVILAVNPAETTTRYDYVAIRYDGSTNTCELKMVKGTNAKPKPVRTSTVYELILAVLEIKPNATEITGSCITDTRLDEDLCGLVVDTCASIPTNGYDEQFKAFFDEKKQEAEANITANDEAFQTWFTTQKDTLSTDVAGKLSLRMDGIDAKQNEETSKLSTIEGQVNELNGRQIFNYVVGTATPNAETCPAGFFYFQTE